MCPYRWQLKHWRARITPMFQLPTIWSHRISTIHSAQLRGIAMVLDMAEASDELRRPLHRVVVFSDSQVSLQALRNSRMPCG
jgi:hypothetical protein